MQSKSADFSTKGEIGFLLLLLVMWAQLWRSLIPTWQHGLYYEYGWLVPPAALFVFWRRFRLLMAQGKLQPQTQTIAFPVAVASAIALFVIVSALRAIEWAAPTWRLPLWAHTVPVCLCFHWFLGARYGKRVSVYFLPVTVLCLTAVPLPSLIELRIIDQFTRAVIASSVAVLPLAGFPAHAAGFTISSMGETVSVSEACSGIRSLQSLFMISIFSGELFLLRVPQRVVLVVLGCVLAFSMNTLRAVALAVIRFSSGTETFDRWHDGIGHLTFLTSGLVLLGIALWIDHSGHRRITVRNVT